MSPVLFRAQKFSSALLILLIFGVFFCSTRSCKKPPSFSHSPSKHYQCKRIVLWEEKIQYMFWYTYICTSLALLCCVQMLYVFFHLASYASQERLDTYLPASQRVSYKRINLLPLVWELITTQQLAGFQSISHHVFWEKTVRACEI